MLTIRPEQMAAFAAAARRRFAAAAAARLRESFPERLADVSDADLLAQVEAGIERAAGYGLTDRGWVMEFLAWRVEHGAGFGATTATAWAGKLLSDGDLTEAEKVAAVSRRLLSLQLAAPADADA